MNAPCPRQQQSCERILLGLRIMDTIKKDRFGKELTSLCMGAYYGTPEGWKAIGYEGNTPLASF